jgi:hypothetical protein
LETNFSTKLQKLDIDLRQPTTTGTPENMTIFLAKAMSCTNLEENTIGGMFKMVKECG